MSHNPTRSGFGDDNTGYNGGLGRPAKSDRDGVPDDRRLRHGGRHRAARFSSGKHRLPPREVRGSHGPSRYGELKSNLPPPRTNRDKTMGSVELAVYEKWFVSFSWVSGFYKQMKEGGTDEENGYLVFLLCSPGCIVLYIRREKNMPDVRFDLALFICLQVRASAPHFFLFFLQSHL